MINKAHATKMLRLLSGFAIMVPAANNRESPGKNGVTTNPVSAKMIRKRMR